MAYEIPEAEGAEKDPKFHYQGIPVVRLDSAVMDHWIPVKKEEAVGKNWMVGPTGYRMWGEQVLCKIPMDRFKELQEVEQQNREVVANTAWVKKRLVDEIEDEHTTVTGDITDN